MGYFPTETYTVGSSFAMLWVLYPMTILVGIELFLRAMSNDVLAAAATAPNPHTCTQAPSSFLLRRCETINVSSNRVGDNKRNGI